MNTKCTYPGRACLLGEHCDWAGGASLAVPLPMQVTAAATDGDRGLTCRSMLEGSQLLGEWDSAGGVDPDGGELRFVPAVAYALHERGFVLPPTHLDVTSTLPAGRGFSSSAAFSLAVGDALARRCGQVLSNPELAELAYHVERELLGVECGRLDQLACAARQPLFLKWEDGRSVEVTPITPGATFHLVVAAFSPPRDTAAILATLNQHVFDTDGRDTDPETANGVRRAIARWAELARQGGDALKHGDVRTLGEAMNEAQAEYNSALATRLPALEGIRLQQTCADLVNKLGAIGAKFSGAGGDGSVVALFENESDAVRATKSLESRDGVSAWHIPV